MLACRHICEKFIYLPACEQLDPIFAYFHPTIRLSVCRHSFEWLESKELQAGWLFFFWLTCNHLDVCMQTDWLATVEWLTDCCFRWMHASGWRSACRQLWMACMQQTAWRLTDWQLFCLAFMQVSGCPDADWLFVWISCEHLDVCMQNDCVSGLHASTWMSACKLTGWMLTC